MTTRTTATSKSLPLSSSRASTVSKPARASPSRITATSPWNEPVARSGSSSTETTTEFAKTSPGTFLAIAQVSSRPEWEFAPGAVPFQEKIHMSAQQAEAFIVRRTK